MLNKFQPFTEIYPECIKGHPNANYQIKKEAHVIITYYKDL